MFSRAYLLLHTVRYMRPMQIFGRLWFKFNRPTLKERKTPPLRLVASSWVEGAIRSPSMTGPSEFLFLHNKGKLTGRQSWNDPARDKLWLYNLHYFDDLNAVNAVDRSAWHRVLIENWIEENPPGLGNGWEPYPLSLRIVNWVKWVLQGNKMGSSWSDSLAMQTRFLRKRLEYHLLGNHLFANAKALVFSGLYFSGEEAEEWLDKGLSILAKEVPEQVLGDGGHFERSPMYHSIILEDLLDLVNVARTYGMFEERRKAESSWINAIQRMRSWLKAMTHPDCEFGYFNDTTRGISPISYELESYAGRLGLEEVVSERQSVIQLADSGYVRLEQGPAVALLDVGEIGPDYLPGHAHADTLSFELSLFGQRVIVNSGISCYGTSDERLRQRGTAAHSTVEIDDENSSEVWGGFRVARRARPFGLEVKDSSGVASVSCAHGGYCRLRGRPVHRRSWELSGDGLEVTDHIDGGFKSAVARYYLHPDVVVQFENSDKGVLQLKNGQSMTWAVTGGEVSVVESSWHPGFGLSVQNRVIEVVFSRAEAEFSLHWEG